MPSFTNLKDFMKYAKRLSKYPLEKIAHKVEEILKEYITINWYNRMTPKDYSRTYQFINSLTISPIRETDNGWEIEIYFDSNKIIAMDSDDDRFWNKHMSVSGEDVSENIPFYIEYGNDSPLYEYEGIHMVENTIQYCKQYNIPIKEMVKELKKYGFKVK